MGDERDPKTDVQELDRLIEEIAYEHWHRMLFARFLAENHLLMYPDPDDPVPVSLAECEDLAADEGAKNGWELAARFATKMLPQIFRVDSPVFALTLPPENQQRLEQLLAELPPEVFTASDSLGWVYQFWQAKRKDEVNASEVKIGARELPAVTQLFTEPYMVSFLLDNSLGAWWAGRRLTEEDLQNAESEQELRDKASLPGVPLEYLRFVRDEATGRWTPAAGTFDAWPESLAELKTLDPCRGSGHFLVAALLMLAPMRMELEGVSAREAVDRVLSENLYGLELDERCCQIAAFALAFSAWRLTSLTSKGETEGNHITLSYRILPELHIACSGVGPQCSAEQWVTLAEASGVAMPRGGREAVNNGLMNLHRLFSQATTLGSLIDPTELPDDMFAADFETIQPYLMAIMKGEKADDEIRERAVAAAGMVKATDLLAGEYTLVITNVPYLHRASHGPVLRAFCEENYPRSKADIATVFLERICKFLQSGGSTALVTQQYSLFLTSYEAMRKSLLQSDKWNIVARLGPGAFGTISGEVINVCLLALTRQEPSVQHRVAMLDVGSSRGPEAKSRSLMSQAYHNPIC